jgi:hypothetical protein
MPRKRPRVLTWSQLHPNTDFSHELGPRFDRSSWPPDSAAPVSEVSHVPEKPFPQGPGSAVVAAGSTLRRGAPFASGEHGNLDSSDEEDQTAVSGLLEHLRNMQIDSTHRHCHGKNSGAELMRDALSVESGPACQSLNIGIKLSSTGHGVFNRRPDMWQVYEVRGARLMFGHA